MERICQNVSLLDRGYRELNPVCCGTEACLPNHTAYGMRNYYLIHYVHKGRGRVIEGDAETEVRAGQMFIIHPGEMVSYVADGRDPWQYTWIGFTGTLAKKLERLSERVSDISATAFEMVADCAELTDTREERVTGCLYLVFSELLSGRSTHPHYVRRAADYIQSSYMQDIRVGDIAGMLGVDRRHLARLFREAKGMTLQEYLIHVRMEQAKRLLEQGISVALAAELVGYNDPFNFSKMFRRYCGISPKQYQLGR